MYRISKDCATRYFIKQTLIDAISFLSSKCYWKAIIIEKIVLKKQVDIHTGIDPAAYWVNFFIHFLESNYVQELISSRSRCAYKFRGTSRLIVDLCTLNDDGEFFFFIKIYVPVTNRTKTGTSMRTLNILRLGQKQFGIIYLFMSFLSKGGRLILYHTHVLSAKQYFIVQYFQSFYKQLDVH